MNLRTKQARQTYEHILVTAEQLLEGSSYEELSIDQICECANISKGGFYHHFSSKDELISLLIGRQMGNLITERIKPCLKEKSAFELLEIYLETTMEYLQKSPRSMLARCWLLLSENPEITNSEFLHEAFYIFHTIVEKGKVEGSIRLEITDEFCQAYLNGAMTGIILYAAAFRETYPIKTFTKDSLKLLWESISLKSNATTL